MVFRASNLRIKRWGPTFFFAESFPPRPCGSFYGPGTRARFAPDVADSRISPLNHFSAGEGVFEPAVFGVWASLTSFGPPHHAEARGPSGPLRARVFANRIRPPKPNLRLGSNPEILEGWRLVFIMSSAIRLFESLQGPRPMGFCPPDNPSTRSGPRPPRPDISEHEQSGGENKRGGGLVTRAGRSGVPEER